MYLLIHIYLNIGRQCCEGLVLLTSFVIVAWPGILTPKMKRIPGIAYMNSMPMHWLVRPGLVEKSLRPTCASENNAATRLFNS